MMFTMNSKILTVTGAIICNNLQYVTFKVYGSREGYCQQDWDVSVLLYCKAVH